MPSYPNFVTDSQTPSDWGDDFYHSQKKLGLFRGYPRRIKYRGRSIARFKDIIYWEDESAVIIYIDFVNNKIYMNSHYKKRCNWEKTIKNRNTQFCYYQIIWESKEFFQNLILGISKIKFKSIKEQRNSIIKFKAWLTNSNNLRNTQTVIA